MNRTFLLAAALLLMGQSVLALTSEQVVNDLRAQGYTRIEVRNGVTQTKVEAIRGTEKLEVVYDRETGAVLKSETEAVGRTDNTSPGISVRNRNRDFVRVANGGDDKTDDDSRAGLDDRDDRLPARDANDDDGRDERNDDNRNGDDDNGNDDDDGDDNDGDDDGGDDDGGDED